MTTPFPPGALAGITVLDLSRVLAGPWCAQILGDLGAEVIKLEQPGQGDDTRRWGPPFVADGSNDSAYYLCANRNKRSIAVDIARPEGAELVRQLAAKADIVIENFRVGALKRYGLDYASLRAVKPDLIYCSITGFGQTGPDKDKGGYDFLIQGMSGLMSVTGAADGEPTKAGIPIADLSTGLYATISILAALQHRHRTGEGQAIDLALLDTQAVMLANQASNWLNGGNPPRRMGNQHPNMVPYQTFACADGEVLVALGNDRQFADFCKVLSLPEIAADPRYASTAGRSTHREPLLAALSAAMAQWPAADLIAAMDAAKLPGGKVNTIPEMLDSPQIAARGLVQSVERGPATIRYLGFPGRLSATPAATRRPPPRSAQDTREVLAEMLGLGADELDRLAEAGTIAEKL